MDSLQNFCEHAGEVNILANTVFINCFSCGAVVVFSFEGWPDESGTSIGGKNQA